MKRLPILTALAAGMLLFSCSNKNSTGLAIPKDAAMVFHINTSSLASKLSWDEIKNTGWFKETSQKTGDEFGKKLMEDPQASGVNLRKDFAFFLQRRGKGGYSVFEGSVKDAAAFEALVKKMAKVSAVAKDGEWNFLSPDDHSVVAWNNSKFAVVNDMPFPAVSPMSAGNFGESSRYPVDSLKLFCKQVMGTADKNSLFTDDRFAEMINEDGDMHLWMNAGSLYSDMSGMLSMMKFGALLQDNVSAATINFDDGKISMKSKGFFGKEMQELMKKGSSKSVEASVLNRIPSNDVIGVMAANVDPQFANEFFKAMGFDGLINMALSKQDLSLAELVAATKGEFVLAFSDLAMQNKTVTIPADGDQPAYTYANTQPDFSVLFATNVNQKATFDKLMAAMGTQAPTMPFAYKVTNDWFAVGNKAQTIDGFLAGNGPKKEFADKIGGHPFGLYIDFQRLLKTNFTQDSTGKSMLAESAGTWKNLIATGGEYKDGAVTGEMVVNFVDAKTNSLKQLNRYIEKMYEASKKNKTAWKEDSPVVDSLDSIDLPPAMANPQ